MQRHQFSHKNKKFSLNWKLPQLSEFLIIYSLKVMGRFKYSFLKFYKPEDLKQVQKVPVSFYWSLRHGLNPLNFTFLCPTSFFFSKIAKAEQIFDCKYNPLSKESKMNFFLQIVYLGSYPESWILQVVLHKRYQMF